MRQLTATAKALIRRPAPEVYEAFANPKIMTKFWFPKATARMETGKDIFWHVGTDEDAIEITVRVKAAESPRLLHIVWGDGDQFTDVRWEFESRDDEATIVRITESGFPGDPSDAVQMALASTAGFNQVLVAAKALLEHNVKINVVKDHVV